jgi:hypothetical protein
MDRGGSALKAALVAVVGALRGDSTLAALATGGVYSDVPENTAAPYVHICNFTETPIPAGMVIRDLTFQAVAVSTYAGDGEGFDIVNRVVQVLHNATLTVSGYTFVVSNYESVSSYQEIAEGSIYRHFPIVFRIVVSG